MTNTEKLHALNIYRVAEGKAPFADWRNARHQPMLDAYLAASEVAKAQLANDHDGLNEGDEPDALIDMGNGEFVRESELSPEDAAKLPGADLVKPDVNEVIQSNDFANKEVGEAFKGQKQPSYKILARQAPAKSEVDKPVGFVHQFLTEHPELSRKEAVAALVAYGINYSTARTQYQKWFSARKG